MPFQAEVFRVPDPSTDFITRSRQAARERVDPKDEYKVELITVESGPKNTRVEVVLKVQVNGTYAFACLNENTPWHARPALEWDAAARAALEKFAATRGLQIKLGPRPEYGMPRNFMIECDRVIVNE
jgi:hypothetical protein